MAVQTFQRRKENQEAEGIVDPSLERTDPTPCIYTLFRQFNKTFFWDTLNMVAVSWSGRQMTSCAGVCSFRPRSGECHIRLSAPLLSLRPRKDLVETLLHEMIHAYLFMTNNNRDREDHGPEFHKHMYRINEAAGTNISVYHTFRDEVRHYQGHVWRCDGPCQKRAPFYGIVRRSTNRAPGHYDRWWERHRMECSGTFQKIDEPAGYKSKVKKSAGKKENKNTSVSNLRNFFPSTSGTKIHSIHGQDQKNPPSQQSSFPKISSNIHTFGGTSGQLGRNPSSQPKSGGNIGKSWGIPTGGTKLNGRGSSTVVVSGKSGKTAASPSAGPTAPRPDTKSNNLPAAPAAPTSSVRDAVRNVWANKFGETTVGRGFKRPVERSKADVQNTKKSKTDNLVVECENCESMVAEEDMSQHLRDCRLENPSGSAEMSTPNHRPCPVCNMPVQDGALETHLSVCLEDSISGDFFADTDDNTDKPTNDQNDLNNYLTCPICLNTFVEHTINTHIDECLNLQAINSGSI